MNEMDKKQFIDSLLKYIIGGGTIATILVAPGMAEVLDKPLRHYLNKLDRRQREREIKRTFYYMRQRGLVIVGSGGYEHGLKITPEGRRRLRDREFNSLTVEKQAKWDKRWRIVFFDIPEEYRVGRRHLIGKLKQLGFEQLQRSVWVHPYPCRTEIELVTHHYRVQKYVSYVEATGIDNEQWLVKRFNTSGVI